MYLSDQTNFQIAKLGSSHFRDQSLKYNSEVRILNKTGTNCKSWKAKNITSSQQNFKSPTLTIALLEILVMETKQWTE